MSGRLKEEKDKPRILQLFLSINYGDRDKREEATKVTEQGV